MIFYRFVTRKRLDAEVIVFVPTSGGWTLCGNLRAIFMLIYDPEVHTGRTYWFHGVLRDPYPCRAFGRVLREEPSTFGSAGRVSENARRSRAGCERQNFSE
jgi:hypothetical protein